MLNTAVKGASASLNGTALSNAFVTKDNALYVKVPKANVATSGIYSLVVQSSTYKVATLTLSVKAEAKASVIRGLKSDVSTTVKATGIKDIDASDLVVEDQYGRVMASTDVKAALTGGKKIVVKKADTSATTVTINDNFKK